MVCAAVNLGALLLHALFEHWPSTHPQQERKNSEQGLETHTYAHTFPLSRTHTHIHRPTHIHTTYIHTYIQFPWPPHHHHHLSWRSYWRYVQAVMLVCGSHWQLLSPFLRRRWRDSETHIPTSQSCVWKICLR